MFNLVLIIVLLALGVRYLLAPKEKTAAELGESFRLGAFSYTVVAVTRSVRIGRKEAPAGAAFVLVRYTIRNEGAESKVVLASDVKLIDGRGRAYDVSVDGKVGLAGAGVSFPQLSPGVDHEIVAPFLVPESVLTEALTVVVPEKGLLGQRKMAITLKVPDVEP